MLNIDLCQRPVMSSDVFFLPEKFNKENNE